MIEEASEEEDVETMFTFDAFESVRKTTPYTIHAAAY